MEKSKWSIAKNTKIPYRTQIYKLKKAYSVKPHLRVMPLGIHVLLLFLIKCVKF